LTRVTTAEEREATTQANQPAVGELYINRFLLWLSC